MHHRGFDCELAANRHQRERSESSNPELIDRLQVPQCECAALALVMSVGVWLDPTRAAPVRHCHVAHEHDGHEPRQRDADQAVDEDREEG